MNRGEIRAQAQILLDDQSGIKFTTSILNDFIDLGNVDLMQRLSIDKAEATFTSVDSEPNTGYASNHSHLAEVFFDFPGVGEDKLEIVSQEELANLYGSTWRADPDGRPTRAYVADYNVLALHPAPDATHAGRTIRITYYPVPADFGSDAATPISINALHDAITQYVVARGYKSLGKLEKGQFFENEYEKLIKRFYNDATKHSDELMRFRW